MKRTVTQDGVPSRSVRSRRSGKSYAGKGQVKLYRGPRMGTPNGVHMFVKSVNFNIPIYDNGWGIGATRGPGFGMRFNLASVDYTITGAANFNQAVPGFVELSALFDQIMLDKVDVNWAFLKDPGDIPNYNYQPPVIYHCADFNDSSVPASLANVLQYGNVRHSVMAAELGEVRRSLRPNFAQIVYDGGAGPTYAPRRGFVNAISDVPHFGVKGYLNMTSAGTGTQLLGICSITVKYYFRAKNTL